MKNQCHNNKNTIKNKMRKNCINILIKYVSYTESDSDDSFAEKVRKLNEEMQKKKEENDKSC